MNSDELRAALNRLYGKNPSYVFLDEISDPDTTPTPSTTQEPTMHTEQPLIATRDQYLPAAELMQRMGGSFVSAIADAFFAADSHNTQRLLIAFPDLFTRYKHMADQDLAYQQAVARVNQRG